MASRRRGGPGCAAGAARPSAPRANHPDRPSLPMTRRQAALATMGLRVCPGRSQQRHALRRCAGRRVAPRAPRSRPPHSHRDRRRDADKSAREQPRHAATSPAARSISAHFHWRKSVPHPVTEYVEVVCIYCGTSFDVTMQLRDRNWVYRRSGLFGRNDQQQGGIPVAVTLQQLDTEFSPEGMLYTTCLELAPTDSGVVNACETDFAALTTGMSYERPWCPQLVIGECKSNRGQITKSDVEHLQRVADALPAKRVSVFLVFAKTGAFSHEEINLCAGAQGRWRPRVLLFSKDELEPYHILDRHAHAGRSLRAPGLEGLAELMITWYPGLRPSGWKQRENDGARTPPTEPA